MSTQHVAETYRGSRWRDLAARSTPSPLSLRQQAPTDWHRDRPAFAGDPDMDWENRPEPPVEVRWGFTVPASRRDH